MIMEINNNNLVAEESETLFPVTFFDGERELDVGAVPITPSLTFKLFQSILSSKLTISPHQITIYFERPTNNHHHHRNRHPVTSKFDFSSAVSVSDPAAFFYVVQKRSRRTRRRKPKNIGNNINSNFVMLRRENNNNNNNNNNPLNELEYLEYLNQMRMIQQAERERERYLMSMSLNSNVYDDLSFYYGFGGDVNSNFSDDAASSSSSSAFCDVCYNFNYNAVVRGGGDDTVPFHWCKNDVVTKVFRSPAGPIAPPKNKKDCFFV